MSVYLPTCVPLFLSQLCYVSEPNSTSIRPSRRRRGKCICRNRTKSRHYQAAPTSKQHRRTRSATGGGTSGLVGCRREKQDKRAERRTNIDMQMMDIAILMCNHIHIVRVVPMSTFTGDTYTAIIPRPEEYQRIEYGGRLMNRCNNNIY